MILRNVPPAEEEIEDPRYKYNYEDFSKHINMQVNCMDLYTPAI